MASLLMELSHLEVETLMLVEIPELSADRTLGTLTAQKEEPSVEMALTLKGAFSASPCGGCGGCGCGGCGGCGCGGCGGGCCDH